MKQRTSSSAFSRENRIHVLLNYVSLTIELWPYAVPVSLNRSLFETWKEIRMSLKHVRGNLTADSDR